MVNKSTCQPKKNLWQDYKITTKEISSINGAPAFSPDNQFLLVPGDKNIELYSVSTGEHVRNILKCDSNLVSCQLSGKYLVTATDTGVVSLLDITSESIETTSNLSLGSVVKDGRIVKLLKVVVDPRERTRSGPVLFASWHVESKAYVSAFRVKDGGVFKKYAVGKIAFQVMKNNFVVGKTLFVGMGSSYVYVATRSASEDQFQPGRRHMAGFDVRFTCVVLHPEEEGFATGDSLGRVHVWRNVGQERPLKDVYHWHSLPVRALAFSDFGSYMFSGGDECVLVSWSVAAHSKTFLPRLSAEIKYLAVGPGSRYLALTTRDGKILIVDSNNRPVSTIQLFSRRLKSGHVFAVDPKSNNWVLNGKTGHLQFLKDNGAFLFTLDITNRNDASRERDFVVEKLDVTHAKFSKSGDWLITAEATTNVSAEARLKFWWFDETVQSFSLNTNIEFPHGSFKLHDLAVSCDDVVVTTAPDGRFKVWSLVETQSHNKVSHHWAVLHTETYGDLHPRSVDFSTDGSLFAVCFGPIATVWDSDLCLLKSSLTPFLQRQDLKCVKFGHKELSHVLVTGTTESLTCWNLITLCILWTADLNLTYLVSDPATVYMCAVTPEKVFVFSPASNQPELETTHNSVPIVTGSFISKNDNPQVLFLNNKQELLALEKENDFVEIEESYAKEKAFTPFSAVIAETSRKDVTKGKPLVRIPTEIGTTKVLEAAAHTLPNPSLLCAQILKRNVRIGSAAHKEKKEIATIEILDDDVMEIDNRQEVPNDFEDELLKTFNKIFV